MQNYTSSTRENWMNMSTKMQSCIQNCTETYQLCSHLVDYCLTKGGKYAEAAHVKLLLDCARICNLSADFMIRHSDFHQSTSEVCSDVCTACSESCEGLGKDDALIQACIDACNRCAESCEEMSKPNQ